MIQLGGKGANLAEMASIGLSVPPGLTISTEACEEYVSDGKMLSDSLWDEILRAFQTIEEQMGAFLGHPSKPLLVSVRSGAAVRTIYPYRSCVMIFKKIVLILGSDYL